MTQEDKDGERSIKKPTGIMTNSECIAKRMERKCQGLHRHITLVDGRAKEAEVYPKELCKEIIKGLIEQMESDKRLIRGGVGAVMPSIDQDYDWEEFWDNISGKSLNPESVRKGRAEEMEEVRKHQVYIKVPIQECWDKTGKAPIKTRWVDVNKGDETNEEIRCRLVAMEINTGKREDLFSATPPLEAKKVLFSGAVTEGIGFVAGKEKGGMKLDFIDVRRAYFHAKARREVYVALHQKTRKKACAAS